MKIEKLLFNSGAQSGEPFTVTNPAHITIFIGPNNSGKSAALSEIHNQISNGGHKNEIFQEIMLETIEANEYEEKIHFLTKEIYEETYTGQISIGARGDIKQINNDLYINMKNIVTKNDKSNSKFTSNYFLKYFLLNLNGKNRLELANKQESQNLHDEAKTTIAEIFKSDSIREQISNIVHAAFGQYLLVDATAMNYFRYCLSEEKEPSDIERSFSAKALEFYEKCIPLERTSDGTRAFIGILSEVIAGFHDILLIDEPEAFLHPGLAALLGNEIAKHIGQNKQMFVATHSPHFLMGCMSAGIPVDIVRLTYRSNLASSRLLPSSSLQQMMHDPLLRSVGVMSALFYESAVVVEADSDRAFYDEINNRIANYSQGSIRHTNFLNAHNKQEAAYITRVLRNLGIPTPMILDIDWIKEDGKVAKKYFTAAGIPEGLQVGFLEIRRQVRNSLEEADSSYKTTGGVSLLSGAEHATATSFFKQMDDYGLFTVRNGELESWLSHLGVQCNKSLWLRQIFKKMGADPSHENYVLPNSTDVWEFIRSIGQWIKNHDRYGMSFIDPLEWEKT